jgi:hypothetical protein
MSEPLEGQNNRGRRELQIAMFAVVCLGLIAVWWITTKLRAAQALGYVDSAIITVRAIVAGEAEFAAAHPDVGYTCTLSQVTARSSPWADELIAGSVKAARRNGYVFEISGCQATDGKKPNLTYYVIARPLRRDPPVFCSDQSGILKFDDTGSITKCLQNGATW